MSTMSKRSVRYDKWPTLAVAEVNAASRKEPNPVGFWLLVMLGFSPSFLCTIVAFECSAIGEGGPASQAFPSDTTRP